VLGFLAEHVLGAPAAELPALLGGPTEPTLGQGPPPERSAESGRTSA